MQATGAPSSSTTVSALPEGARLGEMSPAAAAIERALEDATAPPAATVTEVGATDLPPEAEPVAEPGDDEPDPVDLERLAQDVYDRLRRRFLIERERAGRGARWR